MANYTIPILIIFGVGGVLLHNLVNLNKLNRQNDGIINWGKYFSLERFTIALSIALVLLCALGSQEIKQLQNAGKWLGFGFIAIGYMAQSIVLGFDNKAEQYIKKQTDQSDRADNK